MKRLILFLSILLLCVSCTNGVSQRIALKEGDIRITITEKHVIYERVDYFNSFGDAIWKLDYIESRNEYENKKTNVCNNEF